MKILLKGSRGSTMVEAAMVFPLIILIVAGVIMTGMRMYGHVREDAAYHRSEAQSITSITAEDFLRGKWTVSHGKFRGSKEEEQTLE